MIEYTKDRPLRCFFAFEGYNSQQMALERLKGYCPNFDFVCVGLSEIDDNPQAGRVYDIEGISPTLRTKSGGGSEPQILVQKRSEQGKAERRKHKGDVGVKWQTGNKQWELREDGVANTLTTNTKDNMLAEPAFHIDGNCLVDKQGRMYRIRRLTQRECFRLMDVSEADIDKIQAADISRTQQYKMAGNSIVVGVIYHLFRKLFVEKGNEDAQQRLF